MKKELGFTAYYRRRLLTDFEKINETLLKVMGAEIVEEIKNSSRMYYLFTGTSEEHRRVLPLQWGIPDC